MDYEMHMYMCICISYVHILHSYIEYINMKFHIILGWPKIHLQKKPEQTLLAKLKYIYLGDSYNF